MFVVVQHEISNPNTCWGKAKDVTDEKKLPQGLKVHFSLPSTDTTKAVCPWEGPSVDAIKNYLEPTIG